MPIRRPSKSRTRQNLLIRRRNQWLRSNRQAATPLLIPEDESAKLARVEGILFLAKEPLPSRKISQLASLKDGREVRALIGKLNEKYDFRGQAFRIEQIAGGYRMLTKHAYSSWVRRLESTPAPIRFSTPVIETLSVVAYRQPVLRAEVEAVRGVGCGEVIRQLMERGLVRISGRSEDLGRPFLYATTKAFLETFGLNSLEELPEIHLPEVATEPVDDEVEEDGLETSHIKDDSGEPESTDEIDALDEAVEFAQKEEDEQALDCQGDDEELAA